MNIEIIYSSENDAQLGSGEIAIATNVVTRILENIGTRQRVLLPSNPKERAGIIHEILPWREDGRSVGRGLDSIDMRDGDPENKMRVLVDLLLARMGMPASFRVAPLPYGLDISVGIWDRDSNLWVRMLRGYEITHNEFIMGLSVQTA